MQNLLKNNLLRNSGIYTLTSIFNSSIPFFMLPILTRYLSPVDYGKISMFTVLIAFITPLITLNINGAITRNYYEKEEIAIDVYIWNAIGLVTCSMVIISILLILTNSYITQITQLPQSVLLSAVVFVFSQFIVNILLSLYQVRGNAFKYGVVNILNTFVNLSLSILFVVSFNLGWIGRINAQVIAFVIFSLYALYVLTKEKWIRIKYKKDYVINAMKFGIPLIPHALSGTIFSMTDRVFITNMIGITETGIYTVGYQVGSVIGVLAASFNNAFVPWLYEKLKINDKDTNIKIVKLTYIYFVVILIISIVLGLMAPFIFQIFLGEDYLKSAKYVLWIALGFALNGMYFMVVNYIFYEQKNKVLAITTFSTSMLNIIFNYFFIRQNGAIGAAQATVLVYFIKFVVVWIVSAKIHKMPWKEGLLSFIKY